MNITAQFKVKTVKGEKLCGFMLTYEKFKKFVALPWDMPIADTETWVRAMVADFLRSFSLSGTFIQGKACNRYTFTKCMSVPSVASVVKALEA